MLEDSTSRYYEDNALTYIETTSKADLSYEYKLFLKYLPPSSHIMDLGCGSGRDSHYFLEHNYQVDALDSSKKFCQLVREKLAIRTINSRIQDWIPDVRYDGIWACASLLHLDPIDFDKFLQDLPLYLKANGALFASVKNGIQTGMSSDGRFYQNYSEEFIIETIKKYPGLSLQELWFSKDTLGRDDFRWMNFIILRVK